MTKRSDFIEFCECIKKCELCGLSKSRTQAVPGSGNIDARILVVGECPREPEDSQGIPFVGKSGELLTNIFKAVDVSRDKDLYITNIVKCMPLGDKDPSMSELNSCVTYLYYEIELIKPEIIVPLGNMATHIFVGGKEGISNIRGKVYEWEGIKVVPMYHPSYIVRMENHHSYNILKRQTWEDVKRVKGLLGI